MKNVFFQELMDHLRSVYGPILDLQNLEETFLTRTTKEYEARLEENSSTSTTYVSSNRLEFTGTTDSEVSKRQTTFLKYLNTLAIQLRLLSRTYQVIFNLNDNFRNSDPIFNESELEFTITSYKV